MDINKQIDYWLTGSEEDWEVACHLIVNGKIRHGLFFVHLTVEKLLKGIFCRKKNELAPRTHNLVVLADVSNLVIPDEFIDILADLNQYCLEGRYPLTNNLLITMSDAKDVMNRTQRLVQWLKAQ